MKYILLIALFTLSCTTEQPQPKPIKTYTNVLGDWVLELPTNNLSAKFTVNEIVGAVENTYQTTNTSIQYKSITWSKPLITNTKLSREVTLATASNKNNTLGVIINCYECEINTTFTTIKCNILKYNDEEGSTLTIQNVYFNRPD
jgi:hypothetical protein